MAIYSRDNLPEKIHRFETGVINLDNSIGGGTHWVCYRNVDKQLCEYFLERQKGRSLLDVTHNTKFSFTDQIINHHFLINYFKLM